MALFVINGILLGTGLAMDAFSVSIADGLGIKSLKKSGMLLIAGVFAVFQFLMPLAGWFLVRTIVDIFKSLERFIPYIALILLLYIGIKMIVGNVRDNLKRKNCEGCENACSENCENFVPDERELSVKELLLQGIATSIDALSVGFTIADLRAPMAILSAFIIGAVTFIICFFGVSAGRSLGSRFKNAEIFGGIILVIIGIEIFIRGIVM